MQNCSHYKQENNNRLAIRTLLQTLLQRIWLITILHRTNSFPADRRRVNRFGRGGRDANRFGDGYITIFHWLACLRDAECQDSVCKQSGHVRAHVAEAFESLPLLVCVTPEVKADIETRSQHSLSAYATRNSPEISLHN